MAQQPQQQNWTPLRRFTAPTLAALEQTFAREFGRVAVHDGIEVEFRVGFTGARGFLPGVSRAQWDTLSAAADGLGYQRRDEASSYGATESNARVFDDGRVVHKQRLFVVDAQSVQDFTSMFTLRLAVSREVPVTATSDALVTFVTRSRRIWALPGRWEMHLTDVNEGQRFDVELEYVGGGAPDVPTGRALIQKLLHLVELHAIGQP